MCNHGNIDTKQSSNVDTLERGGKEGEGGEGGKGKGEGEREGRKGTKGEKLVVWYLSLF